MVAEVATFYAESGRAWRQWLEQHHDKQQSVWLIYHKQKSDMPTLTWSEAVDEALCFGWVDSRKKPIDEERYMQFFSRRKPNGTWSKINKEKIQQLIQEQRMTAAGLACIEKAKENGSWTLLDEVEALTIPEDLDAALQAKAGAKEFFSGLSKSVKKSMLQWLVLAKRPETRQMRIADIATHAHQKQKPKQFR